MDISNEGFEIIYVKKRTGHSVSVNRQWEIDVAFIKLVFPPYLTLVLIVFSIQLYIFLGLAWWWWGIRKYASRFRILAMQICIMNIISEFEALIQYRPDNIGIDTAIIVNILLIFLISSYNMPNVTPWITFWKLWWYILFLDKALLVYTPEHVHEALHN